MKKIGKKGSFKPVVHMLLLVVLLGIFHAGVFEKAAEAQQKYPAPVVTSISPGEAEVGKSVELSILGKYFLQGAKLSFSPPTGISVNWVKFVSAGELRVGIAIAKDTPVGPRDITVINPDGQSHTAKKAFYLKAAVLPPPIIISVSPEGAEIGESIELSILGKYFLKGAKLSFSPSTGISVSWVKVLSPEKMSVGIRIAKDAPSGTRDVTITNPNQQSHTAKASFYVKTVTPLLPLPPTLAAPTITSVSPTEADVGETTELVISGKCFTAETQISFAPPTGISIVSLKSVSSGEMRAVVSIASDAYSGVKDVTVTNPDGRSYTGKGIFYVKAAVLPLSPAIANMPTETGAQHVRKSLDRLMTGLADKALNWLEVLKIKMTNKENIRYSTFPEIQPSLEGRVPCPKPPVVDYQTLHVSAPKRAGKTRIDSTPDGSVARPFPTIAQALARADELNYEGIEIIVSRGTYAGDLIITRPTKIIGESRAGTTIVGSITNHSIYSLSVILLSINGNKTAAGEIGKEGALIISNACASTTLEHVNIKSPLNYGIFQSGGKLLARDVRIEDTAALESIASSGTAVHLSNVDATLNGILIERADRFAIRQIGGFLHIFAASIRNTRTRDEFSKAGTGIWTSDGAKTEILSSGINGSQSSALIIEGRQTEAVLKHVTIYDTKAKLMQQRLTAPALDLPPSAIPTMLPPSAFAAIEVEQEARLTMDRSRVNNNEYIALKVGDNSQARITYTHFSHTMAVPDSELGGGTNIQAKDNGYIYLENVTSQHADLCGLQLYGGTADYHIGRVSYNLVGVHITTAGFDISRLIDRVLYIDNGMDLDMETLPVPSSSVPASD